MADIRLIAGLLILLLIGCTPKKVRERTDFNSGWRFTLADDMGSFQPGYDDSQWRTLDLPHDWSIEGEFSEANPATPGGGALPGGIGWYRKSFALSPDGPGRHVYIEFDGVYRNSEVWINGSYLGKRPYGYSSFRYELTPYLKYGEEKNVIAVRVDNSQQPNSRWYSGSGIYRNVWLVTTSDIAVDHWGTFVSTPEVTTEKAKIRIVTQVNNSAGTAKKVNIRTVVYDKEDRKVAVSSDENLVIDTLQTSVTQELGINDPHLWSVNDPYLYHIVTEVESEGRVKDRYMTAFGIRYFIFDSDKGFILNGEPVKIKGVCNHHDLGCLGAAINTRAIERQLEMLKEMGCNAIRTSHNPPAPELLDLCDRMGFIVMDEAFDMWKISKTKYDYSLDFDEWHERDLRDMVLRDRNHPSIFIWSIGNEILEQWDSTGIALAGELAATVRALDTTRPVTSACNDPNPWNYIIRSGALDLIGYNYHETLFTRFPEVFPRQRFIASETTSAVATRGYYEMPSDSLRKWPERWDAPFTDGNAEYACSAYDNCFVPWGTTHERSWRLIKEYDYLSGMFIWTGFDYLGEPTPYWWPARSSYFGIIDLAGFPKDSYYMYQSEWTDKPVLHLFPHWNWQQGQEVDVWAYTNCDEVELLLNGKSLGIRQKNDTLLHLVWRVDFEPGILTGIGRKEGKEVMRKMIATAGEPAGIILDADREAISADGKDLSFVTVTVIDSLGNTVPYADNGIDFTVEGDAIIAGVDNGSQISMESFKADSRKAFNGKCLVVLQAGKKEGMVVLKASSEGLKGAQVSIRLR